MKRSTIRSMAAAFALLVPSCAGTPEALNEPDPPAHEVVAAGNIRYTGDAPELSVKHWLDVYRPKDVTNAPVLLFVHGGAWKLGDKVFHANVGPAFARRGIVTVSINYGLAPWTRHPGQVRDVARAFDWVKRNIAKYGGDPGDVFLCGHSAGGHLVALLALNDKYLREAGYSKDDVSGVIGISGVYRVGGTGLVFGGVFDNDPDTIRDASPAMHVGDRQPPFLILYAERDLTGLDALAVDLDDRLKEHRSPSRLLRVPGCDHNTIVTRVGERGDPVTRAIDAFIRENSRAAVR